MARLAKEAISKLLDDKPLADMIGQRVRLSRPNGKGVCAGPCLCDPKKGKAPLWVSTVTHRWGCLKGDCGGDTFDFLREHEGLDFRAAVERLGGGAVETDPHVLAEAATERARRADERAKREAALDEDERRRAFALWERGLLAEGSLVALYFAHRGLSLPATPSLRYSPEEAYWWTEGDKPVPIHTGPCMLAAIQGPGGKFLGLHRTWLDPRLGTDLMPPWGDGEGFASGKAQIVGPDGQPVQNSKKMRGGKKGGAIRLTRPPAEGETAPLLMGEGIETTRTVLEAMERTGRTGWQAWATGDLGNIAGGALGVSTPHPTKPGKRVPSPEPDLKDPGTLPPPWASRVVLLGDGDSDPLVTGALLERGRARYAAAGVPTVICWSAAGEDFNSMLRRAA